LPLARNGLGAFLFVKYFLYFNTKFFSGQLGDSLIPWCTISILVKNICFLCIMDVR